MLPLSVAEGVHVSLAIALETLPNSDSPPRPTVALQTICEVFKCGGEGYGYKSKPKKKLHSVNIPLRSTHIPVVIINKG